MKKSSVCGLVAAFIGIVPTLQGQELFDFVSIPDSVVLGRLELSGFPARHTEFVGLTFTLEGQEVFGLGSTYLGTFDAMSPESNVAFWLNSMGGLDGRNSDTDSSMMLDGDPPPSSLPDVLESVAFGIGAGDQGDEIVFSYQSIGNTRETISQFGRWTQVPEPSGSVIAYISMLCLSRFRRRKQLRRQKRNFRKLGR